MKYIIIGLGNFGGILAEKLTNLGHEVIGVDNQINKVEAIKEKISYAICLDSTDPQSVKSLPLKNSDVVIVCIGEEEGANILTTALMKKMNAPRLISRSVSPLHETVLEAMGINEIINPEEESAERWVKKLTSEELINSFELTKDFSIIEAVVPRKFVGKTLDQINLTKKYNVLVLTIIKLISERNLIGIPRKIEKAQGIATAQMLLAEGDIMVLFGRNDDIQELLKD